MPNGLDGSVALVGIIMKIAFRPFPERIKGALIQ